MIFKLSSCALMLCCSSSLCCLHSRCLLAQESTLFSQAVMICEMNSCALMLCDSSSLQSDDSLCCSLRQNNATGVEGAHDVCDRCFSYGDCVQQELACQN